MIPWTFQKLNSFLRYVLSQNKIHAQQVRSGKGIAYIWWVKYLQWNFIEFYFSIPFLSIHVDTIKESLKGVVIFHMNSDSVIHMRF